MDTLPFRLVRPMNQLTQLALLKHIGRQNERLTAFNAKLIQRFALLDYVDHRAMLALLTDRAQQPLLSLSFPGLRQTLQAVQRFPVDFAAEKLEFEAALLDSVFATPPDTLSSVEYGALWSLATQVTAWEDVLRLSSTFPLQSTLPLQSEKEFRVVLDQMLVAAIPMSSLVYYCSTAAAGDGGGGNSDATVSTPRGVRLLKELVGEEAALQRALDGIMQLGACWTERECAVSTFVGVVHALGKWPQECLPDAAAWRKLALRPTTFHDVDLHKLLRLLIRLHSPVVPEHVRESLKEALSADLWRCYAELPIEPVAVFFATEGLFKRTNDVGRTDGDSSGSCSSGSSSTIAHNNGENATGAASAPLLLEAMRRLHEHALEKQLRCDGPPLGLHVLISLLVSSAFLQVKGELLSAIIAALKDKLASLLSSSSSSVQPLTPLQASIIATSLDRVQPHSSGAAASSTFSSGKGNEDADAIGKLIVPFLSHAYLSEHGCARCVAELLCGCPRWARQWGLEEGCIDVLRHHAQDGFTKAQLQQILSSDSRGLLVLPSDARDIVTQRATEVPSR
ncbi:hypothetical protein DQ04_17821000 [Trypanosoma grayi]|uniref:hypothetical protein n=1 Tax=Trypanosoma grayi TaxID=71804 RepID=UPI0004F41B0A|nr:hypothetical protein DQ04_17821000 [Trypanosoma grayi]KEG05858.1 hypothetical protein DQ04_17821000 [Trypanosoma grayi]